MTEKEFNSLPNAFTDRMEAVNNEFIKKVASSIKDSAFDSSAQKRVINLVKMGQDLDDIEHFISKQNQANIEDIEALFERVAKQGYTETAKEFSTIVSNKVIPFEENTTLQRLLDAIKSETLNTFDNISNTSTLGMMWKANPTAERVFLPLKAVYTNSIDSAILSVTMGYTDPYSAIRTVLSDMNKSGIVQTSYVSNAGKITYQSIEVATRRNVLDSMNAITQAIQDDIGKQFGADCKEISMHGACSHDHMNLQGKVFPIEEWQKLYRARGGFGDVQDINGNVYSIPYRGIGLWNCKHIGFSFIKGVSTPTYTDKEIKEINDTNLKGFTDDDGIFGKANKQYTTYEITQKLRAEESKIRKMKWEKEVLLELDDKVGIATATTKIREETQAYGAMVSSVSSLGIQVDMNRLIIK